MKKMKFLFLMAALAVSMNGAAQQGKRQVIKTTTQPKQHTVQTVTRTEPQTIVTYKTVPAGWSSVYAQWNPSTFVPKKGDDQSFTGLTLGYSKAIGISASTPLFVEFGGALQYSFYTEKYDKYEEDKFSMFSVKVPVSLVYNWQLPNSSVSIRPYAGLVLRGNISAKVTEEYDN